MQNILSIDATADPVLACVVRCEPAQLNDSHSRPIAEVIEKIEFDAYSAQWSGASHDTPTSGESTPPHPLEGIKNSYSSVVMFVEPSEYTSLNLALPLDDPKSIRRVLDLEVQDLVPFDLDEFLIEHTVTGPLAHHATAADHSPAHAAQDFDVHVSLVPKAFVRKTLAQCDAWGLSPVVVSPPASALSSLYHVAPDLFQDNTAIIRLRDGTISPTRSPAEQSSDAIEAQTPAPYGVACADIILKAQGVVRADSTLQEPITEPITTGSAAHTPAFQALLKNIHLHLGSLERRFKLSLEALYVLGPLEAAEQLQATLGRPVYRISAETVRERLGTSPLTVGGRELPSALPLDDRSLLAACGACFGHDRALTNLPGAIHPLTNLRTREFAYRPRLTEVWRGLRILAPMVALALILALSFVGARYALRAQRIASLQEQVHERLTKAIPGFESEPGKEDATLDNLSFALGQQLKDMVSPLGLSPLEVLIEISRDIPPDKGIIVRSITIKGAKVTLIGNAPDYSALDALERAFKNRKKIYDRVKPSTTSNPGRRLEFNFDITLHDEHGGA